MWPDSGVDLVITRGPYAFSWRGEPDSAMCCHWCGVSHYTESAWNECREQTKEFLDLLKWTDLTEEKSRLLEADEDEWERALRRLKKSELVAILKEVRPLWLAAKRARFKLEFDWAAAEGNRERLEELRCLAQGQRRKSRHEGPAEESIG